MNLEAPELFVDTRPEILEAERAAMDCLRLCLARRRLDEVPLPIPAERWVENPLDFDFGFEVIPPRLPGITICGYAVLGERRIRLNVAIEHDEASIRWTIAHEIGHELLHAKFQTSGQHHRLVETDRTYPGFRYADPLERQADRFAAALLMPQVPLVQTLFGIAKAQRLNESESLRSLTGDTRRATDLWKTAFIPGLAKTFGVRAPGVVYRLADLRLFDGAPLLLPKHVYRLGLLTSP